MLSLKYDEIAENSRTNDQKLMRDQDPYVYMGFGFVAMKKTWLTVTYFF